MRDTIYRQAAIDAMCDNCDSVESVCAHYPCKRFTAIEKVPSAQPEYRLDEWCTDCKEYDHEKHCCPRYNRVIREALSERKTGRWIHDGYDHPHGVDWMHCSVCGRREPYVPAAMTNYCPSCGAKMEVEHDND